MCLNIRSDMLKIRYAKIRPGPIWAPGPGPLLGEHLTKKRTLGKRVQIVFFVCFFEPKKMHDVRTVILAAVSRRDLCYVSENEGVRFVNSLTHRGARALSNWFMDHN